MQNQRRSITFKVIAGYLFIAASVGIAIWYIYAQVVDFNKISQARGNNQQLFLVNEITTNLYETENISRRLIQLNSPEDLQLFHTQMQKVQEGIASLKKNYSDPDILNELDSISFLLSEKEYNLEELFNLRSQDQNDSYYSRAIEELRKVDERFNNNALYERLEGLEPHQRKVLLKIMEFSEDETQAQFSQQTVDSLLTAVRKTLDELERDNQQFRQNLIEKEDELLDNDLILNSQLRKLLSRIEQEELQASIARMETSQNLLEDTSQIIKIAGIISVLVILLFLTLIMRDISKSQRYRIQLEKAKIFAESLLKSREQFMATITHDLRSPLNSIIGYGRLLEQTPLEQKQKYYLENIHKSSDFILKLVNDLLDFSKLEAGKIAIEKLPFNPKNLIEETVSSSILNEKEKNINIQIKIAEEANTEILSDPFRIKQVLVNLVGNAYKFTKDGKIVISAFLERENNQHYLIIKVKDTGKGISKEKQQEIFEEFSQENNSIEQKYGGFGLGLSISKKLVELLNGTIQLESELGVGSEFTVQIPVLQSQKSLQETKKNSIQQKTYFTRKKVLLVDDETSQLQLTQEYLNLAGIESHSFTNAIEALEQIKRQSYDLIITDIQMPKMNGFEFLKKIKSSPEHKEIPVIALSGRTDIEPEIYKQAGFEESFIKPYNPEVLLKSIATILGKGDLNFDEVLSFSENDPEAAKKILRALLSSLKSNYSDYEKAALEANKEELTQIAHKMLPAMKQLQVFEIANMLEQFQQKTSINKELTEKLKLKLKNLITRLEEKIKI